MTALEVDVSVKQGRCEQTAAYLHPVNQVRVHLMRASQLFYASNLLYVSINLNE